MNVTLTPALEKLVQSKVQTGLYNSASEVVREALRLMEQRDRERTSYRTDRRRKIAAGLNSLDRGEHVDGATFFKSLEREKSVEIVRVVHAARDISNLV